MIYKKVVRLFATALFIILIPGCSEKDISPLNMVRVPVPKGGIVFPFGPCRERMK